MNSNKLTLAQAELLNNQLDKALERSLDKFRNIFNIASLTKKTMSDMDTMLMSITFKNHIPNSLDNHVTTCDSLVRLYNIKGGCDYNQTWGYGVWAESILRSMFERLLEKVTRGDTIY